MRRQALLLSLCCLPAALSQTYVDVTTSAGINHVQATDALLVGLPGETFFAGGAAAADFDGDGRVDLVFSRMNDVDILYRNLGNGTFEARTATAGFTVATATNGVCAADIDNDGDQDLYMTATGTTRAYLYLNDGTGVFTDAGIGRVAALSNTTTRLGQSATFGDYDKDGYLDLMTTDWGNDIEFSQSRLLRNLGAANPGFFEDTTTAAGIDVFRRGQDYRYAARFVDLDRDGHLDLAFASDFFSAQLFWNNGDGTFTDGTFLAGVGTGFNAMGSTFGDYDMDGDLDWFVTNISPDPNLPPTGFGGFNRLYRNDGNRQFTERQNAAGVRNARWGWGTSFFDYDNDGDVDLAATNGYNGDHWNQDRTFLYQNNGGTFTEVSYQAGVRDRLQGRGLLHVDYDADGDLDLLIINYKDGPVLYRNDGGNSNDYLRIELEGRTSNRDGVGAFITVTPDLGDPNSFMVWEVDGGSSFLSMNERTAHFGLGNSDGVVDQVMIEWPLGLTEVHYGIDANRVVRFVEGVCDGDTNGDNVVNLTDLSRLLADFGAIQSGLAGDVDYDGDVDLSDLSLLLANFGESC